MSDDHHLQRAVEAELSWEPSIPSSHIGVTAENGVVTLTGHVSSLVEKHAAAAAALRVRGVKGLADELEVRLPSDHVRTDDALAAAILARLADDVSVPRDAVRVEVEGGRVSLIGHVDWHFQKEAAAAAAHRPVGVVSVTNLIVIKPRTNAPEISDAIMHALNRSWFFDPATIEVKVADGTVRLTGTARSEHDRQIAAATAWAAPGVVNVENDIVIA